MHTKRACYCEIVVLIVVPRIRTFDVESGEATEALTQFRRRPVFAIVLVQNEKDAAREKRLTVRLLCRVIRRVYMNAALKYADLSS